MHILRIEHQIRDFDSWKAAFDSDPVGRQQSGVRRHRVLRPIDDPNYVMIDLDFDSSSEAEAFLAALRRNVWSSREARQSCSAARTRGSSRRWRARSTDSSEGGLTPMRSRPLPVSVAAILLVLLSLFDLPFPWLLLFPGVEGPPAFVIYSGIVLGIVGLVVAVGLWMMKTWSFWATIVVAVLNLLLGAPGVVLGPTAALRVTVLGTEVVAVLIIVLVVLPSSRHALTTAEQPSRVR